MMMSMIIRMNMIIMMNMIIVVVMIIKFVIVIEKIISGRNGGSAHGSFSKRDTTTALSPCLEICSLSAHD